MNLKVVLYILFFLGVNAAFCQSQPNLNILFIGNSLTYTNDLPELVKEEAKKKGIIVKTKMIAYPNYALEDHWSDGSVQKLIKKEHFDFVIIQQGPSSQPYGRTSLMAYGKKLKKLCDENKSKLVYFMVWPSQRYYQTFEGVIKNHTDAAKVHKAILAPVGKIWKMHFDTTQDFSYYGIDGFHPSLKGSKAAAAILLKTLLAN